MSFDYSYAADEEIGAKQKSCTKAEKALKRLIIIACVIFAAELIWLFGITPFVPFSVIEVNGLSGIEESEIFMIAGIEETSSFFSTSVKEIQDRLSSYILLESAAVTKRFPDKLSISLVPRQAAAIALAFVDGRQVPICIDKNGVFFKIANAHSQEASLPVISGFENPAVNMRLPSLLVPLAESLHAIGASSPELLSAVSEIRIEPKMWEGYELVLFPVHSSVKVRVENNLSEDLLRYVLLVLNVFDNRDLPEEIDFRSGIGSYRYKEQS